MTNDTLSASTTITAPAEAVSRSRRSPVDHLTGSPRHLADLATAR
jgi:hypothetical protein